MTTLRTAAQHALEALLNCPSDISDEMFESIKSLKAALAEPVQEPVAWMLTENEKYGNTVVLKNHKPKTYDSNWWSLTPLYTTPPQRLPLTEEEIERACVPLGAAMLSFTEVARAIERAHGIGGDE